MPYRTELESRIAKKTTKAIVDFAMIEPGDRIMVGLSGGKDSWALLQILDVLRQRSPIAFSLVAVNVDSGYKEFKHDLIAKTCECLVPAAVPVTVKPPQISNGIGDLEGVDGVP